MSNGLVLIYIKDGIAYPVGMTPDELALLQGLGPMIFEDTKIKVDFDNPIGQAQVRKVGKFKEAANE